MVNPVENNVVIQYSKPETKTKGGIVLPTTSQGGPTTAKVIAVGPGRLMRDGTHFPMPFEVGDIVVMAKVPGREITVDGIGECMVVKESDILAIVRDK